MEIFEIEKKFITEKKLLKSHVLIDYNERWMWLTMTNILLWWYYQPRTLKKLEEHKNTRTM